MVWPHLMLQTTANLPTLWSCLQRLIILAVTSSKLISSLQSYSSVIPCIRCVWEHKREHSSVSINKSLKVNHKCIFSPSQASPLTYLPIVFLPKQLKYTLFEFYLVSWLFQSEFVRCTQCNKCNAYFSVIHETRFLLSKINK